MSINKLNEQLNQGILPEELNFSNQKQSFEIDINKIKYNAFYRTYEFYESKFPDGYQSIPGFDKIISSISANAEEMNINPLDELEKIKNVE